MYAIPLDKIKGLVIEFDVQKLIVLTVNDSILETGGQIVVTLYHPKIPESMHMEKVTLSLAEVVFDDTMELSLDGLGYRLCLLWHE